MNATASPETNLSSQSLSQSSKSSENNLYMLLLGSSFEAVLKIIIIRIFDDSFFIPEVSLVLRVSLCLGFKIKAKPYWCWQALFSVIKIKMGFLT